MRKEKIESKNLGSGEKLSTQQKAVVNFKGTNMVEKALLLNFVHKIDVNDSGHSVQNTFYIPAANASKPLPKLAAITKSSSDKLTIVGTKTKDLIDYYNSVVEFLIKNEEMIDKKISEEQMKWFEQQTARMQKLNAPTHLQKVI